MVWDVELNGGDVHPLTVLGSLELRMWRWVGWQQVMDLLPAFQGSPTFPEVPLLGRIKHIKIV